MTFEAIITAGGARRCFVDGCEVPEVVYDTLRPSKLFPVDTGLTEAEALGYLEAARAAAPPPEHRGPYIQRAIGENRPLRSEALAVHSSQREQVMARNKRHGINVRYDRAGRPVFTDAGQRKALMKLEKVRQMNSYTGY